MTRIFISHIHSDEEIAYKLNNFLLVTLGLKLKEIFCISNPDQELSYSSSSITAQLTDQLKNSEALFVLITSDSLHSAWIPFTIGSFWKTDQPVILILGPGLTHNNLPDPLKNFLSIPIDAQDAEDRLNNAINQLAKIFNLQQEFSRRRDYTLREFCDALRTWESKSPASDISQQKEIEQLKTEIQASEKAHSKELEKLAAAYQQEKQKLEQQLQQEKEELERNYQKQKYNLEQQLSKTKITSNKIIKVFLASSSELKDDREKFEIFINRKNKEYIRKGIFLELVMWEDFLDAMSPTRSQDEYNKAVADSDVFVGLFHTKVGKYTNEEFLKALETFKENSKPLIFTYFKNKAIQPNDIKEDDILSLLNFKKKLSELGHFHSTFNDINHLKYLFDHQLNKFIPKLTDKIEAASQQEKQELEKSQKQIEQPTFSPKTTVTVTEKKVVDYTKLQELLEQQKWKEADEETAMIMRQMAGIKGDKSLQVEDVKKISAEDLRKIDKLWLKHSNGKFGFSIQKKIYEVLEKPMNSFSEHIGWKTSGHLLPINRLTFDIQAPEGHLPSYLAYSINKHQAYRTIVLEALVSRIDWLTQDEI
ncbi:MAG: GUN4 domain-containing protein [Xenococcus sp. MO_188.B8]|nr:GUN4 domain-containing protein [Xenococcus sp. MO_188.B8]